MIGVIFDYAGEIVEVRIDNSSLYFRTGSSGGFAPIEGIKLSKEGCLIEHPDLKDNPNWKEESIKRLKEKIRSMKNEEEQMNYVVDELKKKGYYPLMKQRQGFRPVILT